MKTAILILAYGAPNSLADVEPFYTDIRRGHPPPPELLEELIGRYKAIGGKSPLLEITRKQAVALGERLGEDTRVYVGMRHWTPWIADTVKAMADDGIEEAVAIVMAPHYSSMSIEKYKEHVHSENAALGSPIQFHFVDSWHTEPAFIDALVAQSKRALERFSPEERDAVNVLFTAHSLPEKIVSIGDPYPEQLMETSRLVANAAGIADWRFAYQSAGRTREPWLGPDLLHVLDALAEQRAHAALVCVVGFVADHLEVLFDIDVEAKPYARERGIHLERIDMLNDSPMLIDALAAVVRRTLSA